MADAAPLDLPPVGELVQITTADGWTAVGCRTGDLPWVHAVGRPPVACTSITSWCRVLVLPDTDELVDLARAAFIEHAASPGKERPVGDCCSDAVLSALREAAIR